MCKKETDHAYDIDFTCQNNENIDETLRRQRWYPPRLRDNINSSSYQLELSTWVQEC